MAVRLALQPPPSLPPPLGRSTALRQAMEDLLAPLLERLELQPRTTPAMSLLLVR